MKAEVRIARVKSGMIRFQTASWMNPARKSVKLDVLGAKLHLMGQ